MATYLLNTGEPVIADGMLTQSPFADQYTPTGLLPFERAELTPRLSPDGRVVIESAPITDQTPRARPVLNRPVEEPPVSPPSFSMDITQSTPGTYGYGPVAEATSPAAFSSYGVEDFGALGGANQAEVNANLAAQNAAAAYNTAQPGFFGSLTTPTGMLGSMYGLLSGFPGMTSLMNSMASRNNAALAFDRAMELQGVPGYSTGQIDGQAFSISPGLLGSQVLTGVLPSWFDIEMAENMAGVQAGIDPTTGTDIVGGGFSGPDGGKGVGGYNEQGEFVDAYGQTAATGTMANAEALGAQFGLSLSQALSALSGTRSGQFSSLYNALDAEIADSWGQGFDISTDPDNAALGQASWSQDMTDAAAMAEAEAEAPDWASGFAGWGDSGDTGDAAADDDASGFGEGSDW